MPSICCVSKCTGNYPKGKKVSVFAFPNDQDLKSKWLNAIHREGFLPTKYSRVCELHFEPSQIIREASAYDPRTGRTLTAPLYTPRLRKGAVPTIFVPPPKPLAKSETDPMKPANRSKNNQPNEKAPKKETETTDGSELEKLLQTDTGFQSQNISEPPIVIKQELVESTDESSALIADSMLYLNELVPSSSSIPPPINSPPFGSSPHVISLSPSPEKALPVVNPDSTNVEETPDSNKPRRKRKISNIKPDASDSTPSATQPKLHRLAKSSMSSKGNSMPHPSSGAKKSSGRSIPPSEDTHNATREMFQSLINSSENNPLSSSGTRERPSDLFDVFADFIAVKLREMNWNNCAFALRSILDIVFKAGQVQQSNEEDSDIANRDIRSGSSSDQE